MAAKKTIKNANRQDEPVGAYERSKYYTVLSKEIVDGYKITKIKSYSGATVTMKEPIHTPEEEQAIMDKFIPAAMAIIYPEVDLSKVKKMTLTS